MTADAPFKAAPDRPARERLDELRAFLGDGDPAALALVTEVVEAADLARLAELQVRHADDITGTGPNQGRSSPSKYLDLVYWTWTKLQNARAIGLDRTATSDSWRPLRILDIGAGACHFARVCRQLGHEVVSTDIASPLYDDIAAVMGERRVIDAIEPMTPTPDYGGPFDLVTAIAINFMNFVPPRPGQPYWGMTEWAFFLNDMIGRQLTSPGRLWFRLNKEYVDGEGRFNPELIDLCRRHGAETPLRGVIDWRLPERITVSA